MSSVTSKQPADPWVGVGKTAMPTQENAIGSHPVLSARTENEGGPLSGRISPKTNEDFERRLAAVEKGLAGLEANFATYTETEIRLVFREETKPILEALQAIQTALAEQKQRQEESLFQRFSHWWSTLPFPSFSQGR